MADIFISYVEEDADVVEPLAAALSEAGYFCWHYRRDSTPGTSYLTQITEAISHAKVVLLILSPHTLDSFQVDKEINFAHECNKPFLPITRDLAWGEFQQRRPTWRMAIGTTVAIPIPGDGLLGLLPRLEQGLRALGLAHSQVRATSAAVSPSVATAIQATSSARPGLTPLPLVERYTAPGALPNRTALIGRAQELTYLKAEHDAVAAGKGGRLVFISGDPGVGKTRLAQELGLYAWGKGSLFLEGTYLRDGTAPFGPWTDALRTGLATLPHESIAPLMTAYGAELTQLFPELITHFGSFPPQSLPPGEQRRRLFDGLTGMVVALARMAPVVLVLNDLQWAPSLAALTHLARRLADTRVLVLGTYREHEFHEQPALKKEWLELNRDRLATQVHLGPLAEDESGQLIAQYFGQDTAAALREVVYRRTRGNAFFIEEVLRSLTETGTVQPSAAGWQIADVTGITIPESMKAVVTDRVDRLGELAREVLTQAAVLGQEFGLTALQALSGQPEETLLDLVDRAVTARLLLDRSGVGEERFAFLDDQVQEVLYESLTPLRRRRAHLRAGQILESLYADRLTDHVEELAYHFYLGNDVERALQYALDAGQRAFDLAVWERALRHFETALKLLEQLPDDLSRRASVLGRLATLDSVLDRPGIGYTQEALDLYTQLGDRRQMARLHRMVGQRWTSGSAGQVDALEALAHAEAAVELLDVEPDSPDKAHAHSGAAMYLHWALAEYERSLGHGRQALAIAERLQDPGQIAQACATLGVLYAHKGDLAEAEQLAERSWNAARQSIDPWVRVSVTVYPTGFHWPWRYDRAWLECWINRYHEARRRAPVVRYERPLRGVVALLPALLGRPEEARHALTQAQELDARSALYFPAQRYHTAAAYQILGEWQQARQLFAESIAASKTGRARLQHIEATTFYGRFLLAADEFDEADEALSRAYAWAHDSGSAGQERNILPLLCELHAEVRRIDEAERSLSRAKELLAPSHDWRGLAAPLFRAEGVLATAKGDWPTADAAFAQALVVERAHGFLYYEAQHLAAWAELYFERDARGDRERGLEKLDQALAIFEQCAAKKDVEKVMARRAAVG